MTLSLGVGVKLQSTFSDRVSQGLVIEHVRCYVLEECPQACEWSVSGDCCKHARAGTIPIVGIVVVCECIVVLWVVLLFVGQSRAQCCDDGVTLVHVCKRRTTEETLEALDNALLWA